MGRVVHFEIQTADPAASRAFFTTVFGWTFTPFAGPDYWLAVTGDRSRPGIDGGLMTSPDGEARTVNVVEVAAVDAATRDVVAHGGTVVVEKMPIPNVGFVAYCRDPQGLLFGVYESLGPDGA